jgi:sarcosine oxidase, subunit delta
MLLIKCPVCGIEGDETDFHYGGEAHVKRPATDRPDRVSDGEQRDYLFMRKNPRGLHFERWRCDRGCGKWFNAARDTVTMEFRATYGIREEPPAT